MTTATAEVTHPLTAEEYARLPGKGSPTELVRGRIVELTPPSIFHGYVCGNVGACLREFTKAMRLGRVMTNTAGVVTERGPDTVRGPDLSYYSFARLPGPLPEVGYGAVPPDLAVEVMSPTDRHSDILGRVKELLAVGVTVVCVVNPRSRTATVYRDNQDPEAIAADAELTLPDVLPGWGVPLRQLFE